MSQRAQQLLKLALPLVRTHGFTRTALIEASVRLPSTSASTSTISPSTRSSASSISSNEELESTFELELANQSEQRQREREQIGRQPLNGSALDALFGLGDGARRALVQAWLEEGVRDMENVNIKEETGAAKIGVADALKRRLRWNVPVLGYLPEVRLVLMFSCSHISQRT